MSNNLLGTGSTGFLEDLVRPIYPKLGATKLKDFKATDADRFFKDLGKVLGKRSLMMIKSTLRRSIRRAQVQDLIGKNVVELVDLPTGQPGRPSRAMTEEQAGKVLKVAVGRDSSFVKVVRLEGRYGATHAAREDGELACGNKPRTDAPVTEIGVDLTKATCRACRSQLGVGENTDGTVRLETLFVLSITLGLRPGELRMLTWDLVDLDAGVIPRVALGEQERRRQDGEVQALPDPAEACPPRPEGAQEAPGWHAHEGRHTAVSIMSNNGVPIQDIADTVGHKSTHVTETV